jgi:hypothetical protein
MKMKSQKSNVVFTGASILLIFVFLITSPSWAEIYKWRDASGKIHFTDNLMEIPSDSLTEKHLEEMRVKGLVNPEEEAKKKQLKAEQEREKLKKQQAVKSQPSKKKKVAISAEERKVLASATFFLQNNVIALNKQFEKPLGEDMFKGVKAISKNSIKSQMRLIDQLSQFESGVSKKISKFLQASMATDNEINSTKVYIKPTAETLITRLKNGVVGKGEIIKIIRQTLVSTQS